MKRDGYTKPSLFEDLRLSSRNSGFWLYSAWLENVLAYRSTFLGPLWMVASVSVSIAILGTVYSSVLNIQDTSYFVHLAAGMIFWTYMAGTIQASCKLFQSNKSFLLSGNSLPTDFILKLVVSNLVIFAHQAIILIALVLLFTRPPASYYLTSFAGLILLTLNGLWVAAVLSILGSRIYDLKEIISSVLRVAFLATPILWPSRGHKAEVLQIALAINPFYHFLEITRGPLTGHLPSSISWFVVLGITIIGWTTAWWFYRRYIAAVPLWV